LKQSQRHVKVLTFDKETIAQYKQLLLSSVAHYSHAPFCSSN